MSIPSFNRDAAGLLRDYGELLRQQQANPFRVNAYLRAAETLEATQADVRDILSEEGSEGLEKLSGIGRGLAAAIADIARFGRLPRLERLRGSADPEALFRTVPGLGEQLARRLHEELDVDTLEELEMAAHDGRLASLPGFGPRRAEAVRAGLAAILGRRRIGEPAPAGQPSVLTILDVDREYRDKAAAGSLRTIAPRRFNPEHRAWLPVLHADRGDWHFTALFSNTARAHQLDRTDDWVIIYFHGDDHHEGRCTVVTETQGPLQGQRVVRGREAECRRLLNEQRA